MHREGWAHDEHRAVLELRPGLWHWEAPHPAWEPAEPWSENVSS